MCSLVGFLGCLLALTRGQAQPATPPLVRVRFRSPVEVFFRPSGPIPGAEYRLIMERQLVPALDTLSVRALPSQPGIYFAKVYPESVGGSPERKY